MTKQQRTILAILGAAVLCVFCSLGYLMVAQGPEAEPTAQATQAIQRSGQATKDLGYLSISFGSMAQAQELLKLMEEEPNKLEYQILYETDEDTVLIGCNFDKNVIVRIHQRPDGHGSQDAWHGYILERLNNAASDGSLNDTPEGKIPGTFESF